ncbi:MAG: M28 family peptidase [Verrucomicrobiales bacterium]|nr:M28 family peptidase [Verrucomicrobiales bacterium]
MKLPSRKLIQQLTSDTAALAMPEGRRVGQPGHEKALRYLTRRLAELKLSPWKGDHYALPYELPHPNTKQLQEFTNLIAVIPGKDRSLPPILLGAHYDSVIDAPCADDNATSVALNLAIAEEFTEGELERDLIIALFDAEEPPHFLGKTMGSLRFYRDHCKGIQFAGVIISDLIGHDLKLADLGVGIPGVDLLMPQVGKTVFVLGAESDAVLPDIVEEAAAETKGIHVFPTLSRYIGAPSDHMAFERGGQPTLFLSCAQGRFYHDEKDTLDWINFKKLARITDFVAACIRKIDETPGGETTGVADTVDFEVRMIRQAVGPALPLLMKRYGVEMPKTREEMDALIGLLV